MKLFDRRSAPERADTWFVYGLVDSRKSGEIRYIGITNNPRRRIGEHIKRSTSGVQHSSRWIAATLLSGGDLLLCVFADGVTREMAAKQEIELISRAMRDGANLTNKTLGGDGCLGVSPSAETKAKLSAAQTGRKHTDLAKRLMADAKIGVHLSALHRQKIGSAHAGRKLSDAHRSRISLAKIGHRVDDAAREKIGAAARIAPPRSGCGYKGVVSSLSKWRAAIFLGGKQIKLGTFSTPEQAAHAYDKAAFEAWGRDCYLNFPAEIAA